MSTVSQTPKISTVQTPGLRNPTMLVLAAIALAIVVVYASAVASRALRQAVSTNDYSLYRQSEWLLVPIPVNNLEAYQIFRQSEVASPANKAEANRVPVSAEGASSPAAGNMEAYLLSERTLVVPPTGMDIYLASERTSLPARFDPYQLSEWFGK